MYIPELGKIGKMSAQLVHSTKKKRVTKVSLDKYSGEQDLKYDTEGSQSPT